MSDGLPSPTQHQNHYETEVLAAQEHLRAYAQMMRGLGKAAIADVPTILADKKRVAETAQQAKEREKAERAEIQERITGFVRALPQPSLIGNHFPESDTVRPDWVVETLRNDQVFRGTLGEVRMAEATVWWWGRKPYYEIGSSIVEPSKNQKDARIDLLLAPAMATEKSLWMTSVSMQQHDRAEELAMAAFATPLNKRTLGYYDEMDDGTFVYPRKTENRSGWFLSDADNSFTKKLTSGRKIRMHEAPDDPEKAKKFWKKMDSNVRGRGVSSEGAVKLDDLFGLGLGIIQEFNIAGTCLKLALIFDIEAVYNNTIGVLDQKSKARMSSVDA